jgi:hypothetical protein
MAVLTVISGFALGWALAWLGRWIVWGYWRGFR